MDHNYIDHKSLVALSLLTSRKKQSKKDRMLINIEKADDKIVKSDLFTIYSGLAGLLYVKQSQLIYNRDRMQFSKYMGK